MNAYVVKSWTSSDQPSPNGTYIQINGRSGGLISWLLSLVNISPTVSLTVTGEKINFEQGSWQGMMRFLTPLENTCSTFYGYTKPIKEAIAIIILLGPILLYAMGIWGVLIGIIVGLLYYFLNKTLTIGFTDVGGRITHIDFKRSVIEGQNIDEKSAGQVCDLIQRLVDARRDLAQGISGKNR